MSYRGTPLPTRCFKCVMARQRPQQQLHKLNFVTLDVYKRKVRRDNGASAVTNRSGEGHTDDASGSTKRPQESQRGW